MNTQIANAQFELVRASNACKPGFNGLPGVSMSASMLYMGARLNWILINHSWQPWTRIFQHDLEVAPKVSNVAELRRRSRLLYTGAKTGRFPAPTADEFHDLLHPFN